VALRPAGDPAALVASYEPGKLLDVALGAVELAGDAAAAADFARAARAFRPAPAAPAPALALRCSAARVAAAFRRGATSAALECADVRFDAAADGAYRGGAARAALRAAWRDGAAARDLVVATGVAVAGGAGRAPSCGAAAADVAYVSAAWAFVADVAAGLAPPPGGGGAPVAGALSVATLAVTVPAAEASPRGLRLDARDVAAELAGGAATLAAREPRLSASHGDGFRALASLGASLEARVAAGDGGVAADVRCDALDCGDLARRDYELLRTALWRNVAGGDEPPAAAPGPPFSLSIAADRGAARLRAPAAGDLHAAGLACSVRRAAGGVTFALAATTATVTRDGAAIARPLGAGGGPAFELSVGPAATTLSLADSALVWDGGHWWPLRDWFGFDHARLTEDGAVDGPDAPPADRGDYAFALRIARARVALPAPDGGAALALDVRGDVAYDYDYAGRRHRGRWLARSVDAALGDAAGTVAGGGGGLAVAGLESAELWTSPDETRRYLHVKSSGAVAACATGDALVRDFGVAAACVKRALGWDDAPPAGAPPSKLESFEVTLDGIAARAGGREAAVAGARYARRSKGGAWATTLDVADVALREAAPGGGAWCPVAGLAGVRAEHAASRVAVALARVDVDAPAALAAALREWRAILPDAGGGPAADYELAVASLRLKATAALALALDDVALARRRDGAATAAVGGARVDCDGPRLRCAAPLATATADAATRRASVAVGAATLSLSDALAAEAASGAAAVAAAWAGGALADAAEPAAPAEPWAVDASFAPLTVARGAVALTIRGSCSWRGGAGGGEVDVEDLSVDGAALLVSPARAKATVRASGDGDVACAVDVAPLRVAAAPAALAALRAAAAVGGGGGGASRAGRVSATVLLRGLDVAVDGVGALRLGPAGVTYARGAGQGSKRERNSQLQRLLSRPFSTRFD